MYYLVLLVFKFYKLYKWNNHTVCLLWFANFIPIYCFKVHLCSIYNIGILSQINSIPWYYHTTIYVSILLSTVNGSVISVLFVAFCFVVVVVVLLLQTIFLPISWYIHAIISLALIHRRGLMDLRVCLTFQLYC